MLHRHRLTVYTWQELGAAHTNFDRNLIRKVYWLPRQRLAE